MLESLNILLTVALQNLAFSLHVSSSNSKLCFSLRLYNNLQLCGYVIGGSSGSTHSSSSSESCRSGEPVPVPSQRATFHQMTSSGSSDQIHQPESPRHPQGASPIRPSPPPRSQPINMRRVSDHKAPDLSSLSPPAVCASRSFVQVFNCDLFSFVKVMVCCGASMLDLCLNVL